jgi:hypothetical protein
MEALKGPSGVPMGVLREGPGKAKKGTVSVLEKGRNEEKESEDHRGPFKPHVALGGLY